MAFETVTGYCWPQSVAAGGTRRAAPLVGRRRGRCRSRWPASGASAPSCSPTRAVAAGEPRDAAPTRRPTAAAGPPRSCSTSIPPGARATTRSSSRSTSTASRGAATRSSSCGPASARRRLDRCSRSRRTRGTRTTTSADATSTPAARTVSLQRPMAPGYLYKPPGRGRRVTTTHPPDPQMAAHVGYLRAQPPLALRRLGGLARLGAAVPPVGRARGLRHRRRHQRRPRGPPRNASGHERRRLPAATCRSGTTSTGRARCATPSRTSSRRGGNAAFLSGNTSFWQVRLEDRDARRAGADRWSATRAGSRTIPCSAPTGSASSRACGPTTCIGRPENHMTGVSFARGGYHRIGKRVDQRRGRRTRSIAPTTGCSKAPVSATATCSARAGDDRRLRVRRLRLHLPRRPALPDRRRRHAARLRDPRHRARGPLHPHDRDAPAEAERAVGDRVHRGPAVRRPRPAATSSDRRTATPCSAPTRPPPAESSSPPEHRLGPRPRRPRPAGRADHPQRPRPPELVGDDGKQRPVAGHTLELMDAAVRELDAGPRNQVAHNAWTRTSPSDAALATRELMLTAMPPMSSLRSSISPVCSPIRVSIPSECMPSRISQPQATARAGPSNVASTPSPVDLMNLPAVGVDVPSRDRIMLIEELTPPPVAFCGCTLGGRHDVGEHNRLQSTTVGGQRGDAARSETTRPRRREEVSWLNTA